MRLVLLHKYNYRRIWHSRVNCVFQFIKHPLLNSTFTPTSFWTANAAFLVCSATRVEPARIAPSTLSNRAVRTLVGASGNSSWSRNVASKHLSSIEISHYNCRWFLYSGRTYQRWRNPRFHKQSMHHARRLEIYEIGLTERKRMKPLAKHIAVEQSRRIHRQPWRLLQLEYDRRRLFLVSHTFLGAKSSLCGPQSSQFIERKLLHLYPCQSIRRSKLFPPWIIRNLSFLA